MAIKIAATNRFMHYQKLKSGDTVIEFHNNWLGEETIIVNGRMVSKKSSVWGTNHYFSVVEDGEEANYILTTKINDHFQVVLDLSRNGVLIQDDIPAAHGSMPGKPKNKAKEKGLSKLKEYDLEEALLDFEQALKIDPKDPEIYFHMACAYSVMERPLEGFEALKTAVELQLPDTEAILNHDMLAYLRMRDAFEGFLNSGFKEYDRDLLT